VGFDVGFRFIEKFVYLILTTFVILFSSYISSHRHTREWNRFKDELDIIKFICKEFWTAIFGKQADTLRTNHQGIYVLIDNQFRFVLKISDSQQYAHVIVKVIGVITNALFVGQSMLTAL